MHTAETSRGRPDGNASSSPPTILLVEDDDDTRGALTELLEEQGYRVVAASNGREAQSYLRDHERPSCIVLDLWMPVMDGWTLADQVEQQLPELPMMVITAAEPYWGYPRPARYVMRKPLDSTQFLGMIGSLLAS
jgi:DNA-binding NtrC family response regulator